MVFRILALAVLATAGAHCAELVRRDFHVPSDPGIDLFVRELRVNGRAGPPMLLIHGARVPGIASFDLPVPGGSLAADLAGQGFTVYIMDVRGYGGSTRPPEMSQPPESRPPLVRSNEAVRDISAVVEWIMRRSKGQKVSLLGWATGGNWAGYYATLHSANLSHLVLLNTLYGGSNQHPSIGLGSDLEDRQHPGRFDFKGVGAYRLNTAASLNPAWDRSIPVADKSQWRDPAVMKAYVDAALDSDSTSSQRNPASFRSPSGALEDSFYQASGRQLWDASFITVPTLVIASERDFWSRPADREALIRDLVHAPGVKEVVIPGATHFVHLDLPERGRNRFVREIVDFLRQ